MLLLDEPCSALDPQSTQVIEDLIVKLRDDVAVVIVTHNLQQAYRIADHVAFMYLGDLVEYNSATGLFGEPPRAANSGVRERCVRLSAPQLTRLGLRRLWPAPHGVGLGLHDDAGKGRGASRPNPNRFLRPGRAGQSASASERSRGAKKR